MPFVPSKPKPVVTKTLQVTVAQHIHDRLQAIGQVHELTVHEVAEQFLTHAVEAGEIAAKTTRTRKGVKAE